MSTSQEKAFLDRGRKVTTAERLIQAWVVRGDMGNTYVTLTFQGGSMALSI